MPPNECEEAYIAGRDNGIDDKLSGSPRVLREKYTGQPQHWYVQGYQDGYSAARTRSG